MLLAVDAVALGVAFGFGGNPGEIYAHIHVGRITQT